LTNYFGETITACGRDAKKLFRTTDQLIGGGVDAILPDHRSEGELAEEFNKFFMEKIETIRTSIDREASAPQQQQPPPPPLTQQQQQHMQPQESALSIDTKFDGLPLKEFTPVSCFDVQAILRVMPSKSCNLDPIPTELLKENASRLAMMIAHIVNASLSTGTVPTALKRAIVRPKLKKAGLDKNILKNYRPVSNIPVVAKILEKVVSKQLNRHLELNNLHDMYQSAYRSKHSTETALLKVQTDILKALDNKHHVLLLMTDLSAAFDTVDHDTLIDRLEHSIGLTGTALSWFRSYLHQRKQQVQVGNAISDERTLACGIPQGSILGPILYCLYTRAVGRIFTKFGLAYHSYADDSQAYSVIETGTDWRDVSTKVNDCMEELRSWMRLNKLKMNDDKFEYQLFHSRTEPFDRGDLELSIGDATFSPTSTVRNLGVMLDECMTMEKQIQATTKSCRYHLRSIGKIRRYLDTDACRTLVNALVTSRIDYANSLLYGVPQQQLRKLQLVQNSAARLILQKKPDEHITPTLYELHWLPVASRVRYKILILCHKIQHGQAPEYLSVELHQPGRQLRQISESRLQMPRISTAMHGGRRYDYTMAKEWNKLPVNTRTETDFLNFRRQLKTFLFLDHFN
jgi:hypothetical protein